MAPVIASPQLSSLFQNSDSIRSKIINITCLIGFIQQTFTLRYAFDVFPGYGLFLYVTIQRRSILSKSYPIKTWFLMKKVKI